MIIQCPECKARYRTRLMGGSKAPIPVKCPKCSHQFLIDPTREDAGSEENGARTILIIDDARFFRDLMVDLLKDLNAQLLTAESAEDAWVMLHRHQVDLLITDINLPDKNGLDLVRDIRADKDLRSMRILCMSGVHRKDEDAQEAKKAGADDFISKSFQPDELAVRIARLLSS